MSAKLPQGTFVVEMQHKYAVGDKVRVNNDHMMSGSEGVISALIPFTFVAPGYYVMVNGMVFGASERSLERIETPTPECGFLMDVQGKDRL